MRRLPRWDLLVVLAIAGLVLVGLGAGLGLATVRLAHLPAPLARSGDVATSRPVGTAAATAPATVPAPRPTPAPELPGLDPSPRPTLRPAVDWPVLPEVEALPVMATTAHFVVHVSDADDTLLTGLAEAWSPSLEAILAYVTTRLGRELPQIPVHLVFARAYEAPCPARGLAAPSAKPPVIMLYARDGMSPLQVRAVLAHEFVHHLTSDPTFVGDGILTEGLAHWGAGSMVLAWQGFSSWDEAVRRYLAQDRYLSITDETALNPRPGDDCLERRDRVYNIRTAFVDWLIAHYGLETVLAMPFLERRSRDPETGEETMYRVPDYEAATGHDLPTLERRWLGSVLSGGGSDA